MQEPLSLVFDLVEELQLLAEAARTPYSEVQLVSFGVEILRNTHNFQDGIKSWNFVFRGRILRQIVVFLTHRFHVLELKPDLFLLDIVRDYQVAVVILVIIHLLDI